MPISRFLVVTFALMVPLFGIASELGDPAPLPPSAGRADTAVSASRETAKTAALSDPLAKYPVRVRIPAIGLDSPIEHVGINSTGEMDVPSGKTNHVGWYQWGTVPGESGSAVLAAHVFAAFKHLYKLPVGSEILVTVRDGSTLRFVVAEASEYALQDLSPEELFMRSGGAWLNLITCAGEYRRSLGTYDRRLIIFAKYVGTI